MLIGVYGHLSAKELSTLNHQFASWKYAYCNGTSQNGYHDKKKSVVQFESFPDDIVAVGKAIKAYKKIQKSSTKREIINGVTFYYDSVVMTDKIIEELEKFSRECEDDAYSVCQDGERLVIY